MFRSTVRPLELAATTSLISAWVLSPRSGKHPYLWYASIPVLFSIAIEKMKLSGVEIGVLESQILISEGGRQGTGAEVEANGEAVRGGLDDWRRWGLVRGGIIGSGFLLCLVGMHGEHV
jgi:autophagy-related protein 33